MYVYIYISSSTTRDTLFCKNTRFAGNVVTLHPDSTLDIQNIYICMYTHIYLCVYTHIYMCIYTHRFAGNVVTLNPDATRVNSALLTLSTLPELNILSTERLDMLTFNVEFQIWEQVPGIYTYTSIHYVYMYVYMCVYAYVYMCTHITTHPPNHRIYLENSNKARK